MASDSGSIKDKEFNLIILWSLRWYICLTSISTECNPPSSRPYVDTRHHHREERLINCYPPLLPLPGVASTLTLGLTNTNESVGL